MEIGIMYRREYLPEDLPKFARAAEELGFAELLVVEDAFYTSGIASAAIALSSSRRMRVSLGIMPVTGIPLPLVSYGGSSAVSFLMMLGLVENVHMRRFR